MIVAVILVVGWYGLLTYAACAGNVSCAGLGAVGGLSIAPSAAVLVVGWAARHAVCGRK